MPAFSDYIVFVDESGDHGLDRIDPQYPMFVLAFCVFHKEEYAACAAPDVLKFKFRHFGHDQVNLHEHDIRKARGPFAFLRDAGRRDPFYDDLNALVERSPFTLIASAIQKERYRAGHARSADNPYHVAMGFGLERAYMLLDRDLGCRGGVTHLLFERRGRREDAEMAFEFRRICDGRNSERACRSRRCS